MLQSQSTNRRNPFNLKKNFKPTLPPEFAAEVFRWDKAIRIQGDPAVLPRADIEKNYRDAKATRKILPLFPQTEY